MNYFRNRWYIIGFYLAILGGALLFTLHNHLSSLRLLLAVSLIALLLHQFEEYQFPGYFPRFINTVMFASKLPDRYPLNSNTALIVNVYLGWLLYSLAVIFADKAIWLATATIVVSAANVFAHTILFNVKAKTVYNPGMVSALALFSPVIAYYVIFIFRHNLLQLDTLLIGVVLGVAVNYFGIVKLITWLSNKQTQYIFKPFR